MSNARSPLVSLLPTLGVLCFLWLPLLFLYGTALLRALVMQPAALWEALPISTLSRTLLGNTIALALLTVLGTVLCAWPVAVVVARCRLRWCRLSALLLCALPLALPPTLMASAYLEWTRTPPTRSMASLAAQSSLPLHSVALAAILLALCYFPLIAFPVAAAWRALPREWEEAADGFGPPYETARRVLWPLLWPAVAGASGLVAAVACWEMGAPDLLDARTYAVQIYRTLSVPNSWDAGGELKSALAGLPMLALGALALWPALRALRFYRNWHGATKPAPSTLDGKNSVAIWFAFAIFSVSPMAPVIIFARQLPSWATMTQVWSAAAHEIFNTAALSTVAAAGVTLLAFALVVSWSRWPTRWRQRVLWLSVTPFFVAPLLQAVALIHFYNRPVFALIYGGVEPWGWEPFDTFFEMAARYGLLLVGYATRFLPLAILLLNEAMGRMDIALLEAAASVGAAPRETTRRVLWPQLKPALLGVFALVWALCASELSMAVLINAPGGQTLPVPIFNWMHIASTPEVATLSLTLATMSGGVLGAALFLLTFESTLRKNR